MKKLFFLSSLISLLSSPSFAKRLPGQLSGELSLENRYFLQEGQYGNQEQGDSSVVLKPEYTYSWDQDRKVISFIPYARLSQLDENKTHADLRELSFVGSFKKVEIRAGVSKVFWGVTESQHLVDVINQTDLVENPDGEDKLGQPMINPTFVTDYGNIDLFVLPYFRERTFAGKKGRLRGQLPVNINSAKYLHKDKEKHVDYAARWSHYFGSLEWGLSYFKGTDREPGFELNNTKTALNSIYGQAEQFGLELQYNYKDWLFKSELLKKDSQLNGDYFASVTGFEYTFSNIKGKGIDIGLLYEWLYDDRKEEANSGLHDNSFIGTRIAFNDEKSTEVLLGGSFENEDGDLSLFRVETSRRINENWKWEFEANFVSSPKQNSLLHQIKDDDYIQFSISYFW